MLARQNRNNSFFLLFSPAYFSSFLLLRNCFFLLSMVEKSCWPEKQVSSASRKDGTWNIVERAAEKWRGAEFLGAREGKDEDEMSRCLVRLSRKKMGK